jgi:hypothetical protein
MDETYKVWKCVETCDNNARICFNKYHQVGTCFFFGRVRRILVWESTVPILYFKLSCAYRRSRTPREDRFSHYIANQKYDHKQA